MSLKELHAGMKDRFGRSRTVSLFVETVRPTLDNYQPIFTLKEQDVEIDGKKYLSLKQIYMSYNHIPELEYEFAIDTFGSWEVWKDLENNKTLRAHIAKWREEMEIKLRATAIKDLINVASCGGPSAASAAKWLAEKGYIPKNERGRPSKAEVARETKIQAGIKDNLDMDMERLGIIVNNK